TIKYSPAGVRQWVARYNHPLNGNDYAAGTAVDLQGNVFIAATSDNQASGTDIVVFKYNPAGDTLWVRRFTGPYDTNDGATCLSVDSSGNVYVGGYSWSPSFAYNQYVVLKYSASGSLLWSSFYDAGGYANVPHSMVSDGSGNVYVFGNTGLATRGFYLV